MNIRGQGTVVSGVVKHILIFLENWILFEWSVWKYCRNNPIYPQGETWPFDRAGWCSSSRVNEYNFELTPYVRTGDTILFDYEIEPHKKTEKGKVFLECHTN